MVASLWLLLLISSRASPTTQPRFARVLCIRPGVGDTLRSRDQIADGLLDVVKAAQFERLPHLEPVLRTSWRCLLIRSVWCVCDQV